MKKIVALVVLVLFLAPCTVFAGAIDKGIRYGNQIHYDSYKTYFKPGRPPQGSLEELYQDVFITMLLPYIQEAVRGYYEKNTGYSPIVDPWQPDILYIERPNGYRTFEFIIKLEVKPYLGAHNSIGEDYITLRVSYSNVKVEKFEHNKDYPIPPWLQSMK